MLSRDGRPTPLGDAIAHYGRIAKTLHILRLADEPGYRRQIKVQANLQEGRHALAGRSSTAAPGSSTSATRTAWRTRSAPSDSSSTPWSCSTPGTWTPPSPNSVPTATRSGRRHRPALPVRAAPRQHARSVSFQLPDLPGGLRPLRDKNASADDE
ncbi:hypothetical protein GCM10010344_00440 [Streptomyces bluensis]|nr:hypothetical protein GCM10010344_00440 [Streptomyces bluensis]